MGLYDFFVGALSFGFSVFLTCLLGVVALFTVLLITLPLTGPSQYFPSLDKSSRTVDEHGKKIEVKNDDGKTPLKWKQGRTVQIVVLGDIGRSPRMQYHALSIANHGGRVFLIGYHGMSQH